LIATDRTDLLATGRKSILVTGKIGLALTGRLHVIDGRDRAGGLGLGTLGRSGSTTFGMAPRPTLIIWSIRTKVSIRGNIAEGFCFGAGTRILSTTGRPSGYPARGGWRKGTIRSSYERCDITRRIGSIGRASVGRGLATGRKSIPGETIGIGSSIKYKFFKKYDNINRKPRHPPTKHLVSIMYWHDTDVPYTNGCSHDLTIGLFGRTIGICVIQTTIRPSLWPAVV